MKKGIQMDLKDNVGVVIQDVFADEQVEFDTGMVITALDNIDLPHKIAIKDINPYLHSVANNPYFKP